MLGKTVIKTEISNVNTKAKLYIYRTITIGITSGEWGDLSSPAQPPGSTVFYIMYSYTMVYPWPSKYTC